MINDKCSGFALITVMFMLVTLSSAVFFLAYIPISQKRDIAKEYLINMKGLELKRAVFGRLAEQRGGKFTSCTGLYSELGSHHHYAHAGYRYTYRVFSKRMYQGREQIDDLDYRYDSNYGLWAGYRGNSYYHMSPCDESYYSSDAGYEVFGKGFEITDTCHQVHIIRYYFNDGRMRFIGRDRYLIKVKDYTKTAGNKISLELVSAETGKTLTPRCAVRSLMPFLSDENPPYLEDGFNFVPGSDTMLLPTKTEDRVGYKLHSFLFCYDPEQAGPRRMSITGLIKVIIRKKENGNWNTVFTQPIVVPARYYDEMNAYVEEIEYYG